MVQRIVRPGELLAMDPSKLSRGADGFFWEILAGIPENERSGSVGIVHVRGALSHHKEDGGDSYESIYARVVRAYDGLEGQGEASFVLMCFDTPGGVVSGLDEFGTAIQKLRRAKGRPLIGWVNEMAASAGYSLASRCDEVFCPKTAIVGSIGVVSTIVSQAAADKAMGLDVRLITSGARKADGHIHVPITNDAIEAERARVDELALGFFRLVADRRGMSVAKVRSLEANIFLGPAARRKGLVDGVTSLPELLGSLEERSSARRKRAAGGNETDRRVDKALDSGTTSASMRHITARVDSTRPKEQAAMPVALDILIKKTEAKLTSEHDPHARAALTLKLANYLAAKKDADDEDEDDDEDDDEKKAAKKEAARAAGEAAKKAEESKQAEEAAKKAKKAAHEEEEEAKALLARGGDGATRAALAILEEATGLKGPAAVGAGMGLLSRLQKVEASHAEMAARAAASERESLIARATKYVPARLVAALGNDVSALRSLVAEAEKGAPLISTEDGDLMKPKAVVPGTEESLSKDVLAMIDSAVLACPASMSPKDYRAALVKGHLDAQAASTRERLNGAGSAGGRY
jgi:ClpP class serine protease